ncbi:IS200/IS605 family transposase, partial [Micromonospora sp. NPDC003197]
WPTHGRRGCSAGPPSWRFGPLAASPAGSPSSFIRQEFPEVRSRIPTLWTNSYLVATVGGATLEIVKRYVESQRNV